MIKQKHKEVQGDCSPHSPGLSLRRIDLPEPVIVYFQKRGMYIKSLPSYEQIEGRDPMIPDSKRNPDNPNYFLVETCPVENASEEARLKAENHATELLSTFTRNPIRSFSKISRTYMLNGLTKPIRVSGVLDTKVKNTIYVKKPSIERIFGIALYNLLAGLAPQDYIFNNYSFIERGIEGEHVCPETLKQAVKRKNFLESLVRLSTLDEFLSITDLDKDIGPKGCFDNFLVQYDGTCIAFDFNTIFEPGFDTTNRSLLNKLKGLGVAIPPKLEQDTRADEARKIIARLNRHSSIFEGLISLIDKVPYMKERFKESGFKSAEAFFKDKARYILTQT